MMQEQFLCSKRGCRVLPSPAVC